MSKLKATTFNRLSIQEQARFCLKIENFTALPDLVEKLSELNPIISHDKSNRFTLHSDRDVFSIGKIRRSVVN